MESHDKCRRVVHRPYSSCISSVQNPMGTPLSSPCQLGLGVWLSCLRLSCYTWELRENLGNVQELVDRFEKEYREEARRIKKRNLKEDHKRELPERYTAKLLYGWDNRKFDRKDWKGIGDDRDQEGQKEGKY